jgi:hypothetical protein
VDSPLVGRRLIVFHLILLLLGWIPFGMEEIDNMWQRLSLNEIEGDRFNLRSSTQTVSYFLAAKFYTRRVINVEAVTRTFKPLWRTERGFSVRDMGDNILLFEFEDEADMERVLFSEPWSYDKYLIAFRKVVEDVEIEKVVFDQVTFWVQIHNLPILSLKKEVVEALGRGIGEVMKSTESDEELGGGRWKGDASQSKGGYHQTVMPREEDRINKRKRGMGRFQI